MNHLFFLQSDHPCKLLYHIYVFIATSHLGTEWSRGTGCCCKAAPLAEKRWCEVSHCSIVIYVFIEDSASVKLIYTSVY